MLKSLLDTKFVYASSMSDTSAHEEADVPTDPKERAFKRMDDAAKRSGVMGMITATERRVKATAEKDKLQGVVDAISDIMDGLKMVSRAASAKAR